MKADLYLIALVPPPPLREQVRALKLEMQQHFGAGHALKAPAHITLEGPFRLSPDKSGTIGETLSRVARLQRPFTITLRGFDCFSPRVIFIRIEDHIPVIALVKQLTIALSEAQLLQKRTKGIPFHPHMTIATRDLEPRAFAKALEVFKDRPFNGGFKVDSLFLLKHNGSNWDIFREYDFGK